MALLSNNQPSLLILADHSAPPNTAQKKTSHVSGMNFHGGFTLFQVYTIIKKHSPTKVITYGGIESFYALLLKVFFRRVVFYRFKGNKLSKPSFWNNLKLRAANIHIKSFIAPSDFIKEHLMQQTKKEIKVILMAIDKEKFRFLNTATKNELLIVGRLDPVKGLQKALLDFSNIKKNLPKLTLRIMGEPKNISCLLYTSPSPRDRTRSRMPSSA